MKKILQIVAVLIDYFLLIGSISLVLWTRSPQELALSLINIHLRVFVLLFVGWIVVFFLFNLYNFEFPVHVSKLFFGVAINILWSSLVFYLFPIFIIAPKTNMVLMGIVSTVAISVWHKIVDYIFTTKLHGHEIMFAVADEDSFNAVKRLAEQPRYKYTVCGVISNEKYHEPLRRILGSDKVFTRVDKFEIALKHSRVQTIVCAEWWFSKLHSLVYDMLPRTLSMTHVINLYEKVFKYIPIHSASEYWVMSNMDVVSMRAYLALKRVFDILFALVLIPFTLPICFCVALAIKLFGGSGPVFFTQERVGLNNTLFTLIKFRTMRKDAEKNGAQWTAKNDARVTKLGRLLRVTRLDELPQIINVLKGDMSFIGPRPERMVFVKKLIKKVPHYQLRHIVKPGLSGWAQVNYCYTNTVEDTVQKVSYDIFYVKRLNIILDIQIFFKTLITVLTARGQ